MIRIGSRKLHGFIASMALIVPIAWLGLALAARSDDGRSPPSAAIKTPPTAEARYMGSTACALCHDNGSPKFATNLVGLDEFHTWSDSDHHRFAYSGSDSANPSLKLSGLKGERAQRMERALHWPAGSAVKAEYGCVNCHATSFRSGASDPSLAANEDRLAKELALGVGCESCHGPSSLWIDKHWKRAAWRDDRELTPQLKHQKYGMIDVREPVERTELCVSCHIGNVAEGKFVTHEMFAAGHPPLGTFEVETALNRMPPHWRSVSNQTPDDVRKFVHYQPLNRTRSVALEGLVELRSSIANLADAAAQIQKPEAQARDADGTSSLVRPANVADFALYDCSACHHELVVPSLRQEQGFGGLTPGRPRPQYWSAPLAEFGHALASSGGGNGRPSTVAALLAPLDAAMNRSPFGDSTSVEPRAKEVVSGLDKLIESAAGQKTLDLKRLVGELRRLAGAPPRDRESAMQLAAAIGVVVGDLSDPANADAVRDVNADDIAELRNLADKLRSE
jgi:hypothetical protein